MPLFESLSSLQLIILGLLILTAGFMLRRSVVLGRRSRNRDVAAEVRHEMHQAEQSVASRMQGLEVRLYDFEREVEAKMESRFAQLDQLIVEADGVIDRLRHQIREDRRKESSEPVRRRPDIVSLPQRDDNSAEAGGPDCSDSIDAEVCRMIGLYRQAGYSPPEIARLVDRTEPEVRAVLQDERFDNLDDAA